MESTFLVLLVAIVFTSIASVTLAALCLAKLSQIGSCMVESHHMLSSQLKRGQREILEKVDLLEGEQRHLSTSLTRDTDEKKKWKSLQEAFNSIQKGSSE